MEKLNVHFVLENLAFTEQVQECNKYCTKTYRCGNLE